MTVAAVLADTEIDAFILEYAEKQPYGQFRMGSLHLALVDAAFPDWEPPDIEDPPDAPEGSGDLEDAADKAVRRLADERRLTHLGGSLYCLRQVAEARQQPARPAPTAPTEMTYPDWMKVDDGSSLREKIVRELADGPLTQKALWDRLDTSQYRPPKPQYDYGDFLDAINEMVDRDELKADGYLYIDTTRIGMPSSDIEAFRLSKSKATKGKGTSKGTTTPEKSKLWNYGPFPKKILKDPAVTAHGRLAAGVIACSINSGPWNKDRTAKISMRALAADMNVSSMTAQKAVQNLVATGWLEVEQGSGKGTSRYRFTDKVHGVHEDDTNS